ncbi:hypothetical protein BSKO_12180 [Bryopsis sp. KO-2023]|nr:hypothetical protein BSKO_12180 [Bryopsis sp. KO-2023]
MSAQSSANGELASAQEDVGRVVKKQKICSRNAREVLDRAIKQVERTREALERCEESDPAKAVADLQQEIERQELVKGLLKETREMHSAIGKLGKTTDKYFVKDICRATRDVKMDHTALNQVIAEHLLKEGRFEVGEKFVKETGIEEPVEVKELFKSVHKVLSEIRAKNLDPVLRWAEEHRSKLSKDGEPSPFEFQLHRLRFLHILEEEGQEAALRYARGTFQNFTKNHMHEIEKLMGLLVFNKHPRDRSPYSSTEGTQWDRVASEFMKQACGLMGQPHRSPLLMCVAAGSVVLPEILKLAEVMEMSGQDIKQCAQLPLELSLGQEFQFHSIFACPVSKDQSTTENPPMLMPCGHILCEQSILKISKQKSRPKFKCPYCPAEAVSGNCRKLIFPDFIE